MRSFSKQHTLLDSLVDASAKQRKAASIHIIFVVGKLPGNEGQALLSVSHSVAGYIIPFCSAAYNTKKASI